MGAYIGELKPAMREAGGAHTDNPHARVARIRDDGRRADDLLEVGKRLCRDMRGTLRPVDHATARARCHHLDAIARRGDRVAVVVAGEPQLRTHIRANVESAHSAVTRPRLSRDSK